ncbi:MAG: quinone-dependent dihydroorotate dehydrogenase [Rhodospirillaceae bacterium]|nr:quinone-dependent dihydroorotate dehydrogenase [Rhodospirillaceae bacterium]MBL6930036.1 quinone-dependent dihydroorotate dehydrogenase [Rhodospirillales bacterium]MBL6940940.1 quinone-dependent dihydroorotate dehydrogenase [Rhodospirillales bacterium]
MIDLYRLAWPFIRLLDPETAHGLAIKALRRGLVAAQPSLKDPVLEQTLWGRAFANPVGLAAGFDKNADVIDAMLAQGFGFVEIGSVTPRPQPGNPRPRLFRLPAHEAIINRMGFNNDGLDVVAGRLEKRVRSGILGVNLGKNKDSTDANADYVQGIARLAGFADYLVVNVSSPNTPGLRALQGREPLQALLEAALQARSRAVSENPPPLLLKIAPDLTDEDKSDIAEVALATGIDGLIATNTTIDRPQDLTHENASQSGGLSGRPLFEPSTRVLGQMYQLTGGRIPLIGVGGISSGADAYAKIRAGASLVQFYSAMVYHGPGRVQAIKRELAGLIKADGFTSITQAIGADQNKRVGKT